jgi:phosphoglucan,water dikinase
VTVFIGNQTSWAATSPTEPFGYAVAQGFDAFEWFPDKKPGAGWDGHDLDAKVRNTIRETAHSRGMRLSVHARWQANPFSPDGLQLLWEDLELARDLDAKLLNIHLFQEQGLPRFIEVILPVVRRSADAGLQLSIENTPHHSPEQFNELFSRIRATTSTNRSNVGMCFDLGHANLCSATQNDYLGFWDRLDPHVPVIHLHLHENWGDTDSHLPLFTGPAARDDSGIRGFVARLEKRSFSGSIILEQWPHPPSLLDNARNRLLQLWKPSPHKWERGAARGDLVFEPLASSGPKLSGVAEDLVAGNRRSKSWREKLEVVRELLAREMLEADQLVDIAIYLRFLGTGEISCVEDGRHFRPAHHARMASEVYERLNRLRSPDNEFVLRKIYPWLPSSDRTFQRPEPLTRIRDIAHRNDIGPDLKREIKTTLQNKLHRCAGPEDLVTASALLDRISAPGAQYPPGFVEQFRIFHQELKEFFNARSLDERVQALLPVVEPRQADLIRQFLKQKTGSSQSDRLAGLQSLTKLRHIFAEVISRNDKSDAQNYILADIALEDFAFVLLSQIINDCESSEPNLAIAVRIETLTIALDNLVLGGIDPEECRACHSELAAWGNLSASPSRNELLRLKASVSRCRRMADDFGARTVALFSERALELGKALGVAEHSVRVFSESDIRSHLVFQVSKLADILSRRLREWLGLPPWDVIVAGRAIGRVTALGSLEEWKRGGNGPAVVLLKNAAGDEEIPTEVAGIVLAHGIPHLSHLSVRARQAGIVFAACEEIVEFERLQARKGQLIILLAAPDKVGWETTDRENSPPATPRTSVTRIPEARLSAKDLWIGLDAASLETGGGKVAGLRRLHELSNRAEAGFHTPSAFVIPFGVMEQALGATPTLGVEYWELVKGLDGISSANFADATRRLRVLLQRLPVPEIILTEVQRRFPPRSALVFRSSANCEDLEGFAGAGLYESVLNVSPSGAASAIRTVWSSLWTDRAAQSRRAEGIAYDQAHMAVLVQELLDPDLSFVLHTVNPVTQEPRELYAEIVVGLGEALVSATNEGSPYRLTCDKQSGAATLLAFANFSQATRSNRGGGLRRETIDYSQIRLSREPRGLEQLAGSLCRVGSYVESAFGSPQDIEGVILKQQIYLVQARPQQGLQKK